MKAVRILPLIPVAIFLTMCRPVSEQQQTVSMLDTRVLPLQKQVPSTNRRPVAKQPELSRTDRKANEIKSYAQQNGYSTRYCFLVDLGMESGLKRFFVYDLLNRTVAYSGLVAHGSCEENFLKMAKFSNEPGGECTSLGLYKVGYSYYGQYGKAYKLYGLQSSNSNAFKRAIVLHGNNFVPEEETYPKPICNSSGCPMVSFTFLKTLSSIIDASSKPLLLWVYADSQSRMIANR